MGFTALHVLLWLVATCTLTTQDLASLSVSPKITAVCGQKVVLHCDVSSSHHGLSIRSMGWSQNQTSLCSVDSEDTVTIHPRASMSSFTCDYRQGQLSLTFEEVQPMESGLSNRYRCKLQSNKGASHDYTTVELQECVGKEEGFWKDGRPTCTFTRVHPDGEVHWFHGSRHLRHGHFTSKRVEDGGWLTIHSYLETKSSDGPYNCSLRNTKTGRYMASALVEHGVRSLGSKAVLGNGVGSQGPMETFLIILVSLVVALN